MLQFVRLESGDKMLKLTNVVKAYRVKPVLAIEDLSLEDNKLYGIVGPNGAGKTTLFKCITNVVNNYSGKIELDEIDIKKHPMVLSKVGLVLDGMSVYSNKTAWFNIKYFAGLRESYNEKRVLMLAKSLKIDDVLNKKVAQFSYGMKKKLILLIALMNNPKLLILDEPFRGLDIETVNFFKGFLKELQKQGLTLLISSHVLSDIEDLCDEVIIIKDGQVAKSLNIDVSKEKETRFIKTTDNERFRKLLDAQQYPYVEKDGGFRLEMNDERWNNLYQQSFINDVKITEMSLVSIVSEGLESVSKGGANNEL